MKKVALPGRLFRALDCEIMIVTNAAGGINRSFEVGDLMVITDHIGFPLMCGNNPLVGPNEDMFGGPRYVIKCNSLCGFAFRFRCEPLMNVLYLVSQISANV